MKAFDALFGLVAIALGCEATSAAILSEVRSMREVLVYDGSVYSEYFEMKLAVQVVRQSEVELVPMLSHLQQREFIYDRLAAGDIEYTFKHALTHDVAYNSILAERRKLLHERVADDIESLYANNLDDHLGELARQYARSGNSRKTVQYALAASEHAMRRAAHTESIAYLSSAIQSLRALPPGATQDRQELELLLALWEPLSAVEGFAGPKVEETLSRAMELCALVGTERQLSSAFLCRTLLHTLKSEFDAAIELSTQALELARRARDPALELLAENLVGMVSVFDGQFVSAREHLDIALAIASRLPPSTLLAFGRTVRSEMVHCMNVAARNLWFLGYPDQALKMSGEVLRSARLGSAIVHNHALSWITVLRLDLRDWTSALELAEEYVASGVKHGLSYTLAEARILRGLALVHFNRTEEGFAELRGGSKAAADTGATRLEGFVFLADCYAQTGQAVRGLAALDRAERLRNTGMGSDFLRIKGELLLAQEQPDEPAAEACFREAVELARRQSAKSLELRAAIGLARLLAKQNKRDEARAMLADIYNWFSEGFNTADLKEAKGLLEKLNA